MGKVGGFGIGNYGLGEDQKGIQVSGEPRAGGSEIERGLNGFSKEGMGIPQGERKEGGD